MAPAILKRPDLCHQPGLVLQQANQHIPDPNLQAEVTAALQTVAYLTQTHPIPDGFITTAQLINQWRPGSSVGNDEWSWADETLALLQRSPARVTQWIATTPSAQDPHPISLGNDGRVWDGHHRIIASLLAARTVLPVLHQ